MIKPIENYEGFNITFQTTEDCNLQCKYCLTGETQILMADYSLKPICDIVVGDEVMGFNEKCQIGKCRHIYPTRVKKIFKRKAETIKISTLSGKHIYTTAEHPFLIKNKWVPAGKIKEKHKAMCFDMEKTIKITSEEIVSILQTNNIETVYNFETESHTYIANSFMVHNCYEINKRRNDLPLDYAKKFIDMILETDDPLKIKDTKDEWILNQGLILDFIGGDSFMRPQLMDDILSYFQFKAHTINHRWANRWRASVSTNGVLFNDPKVRELMIKYKNNLSVGVSIDGCPEIHDKNRIFPDGSGSMNAILKWWNWYLDWAGESAGTKATLNKDSIPYICKSIQYLHEVMRLKHINMNFIFEEMNLTEEDYQEIERQFEKSIDYIFEHRDDLYVSMFSREFGCATKSDPDRLNESWCGGGLMPCVTPSGDIFPCFRFTQITMEEGTELLKLGNVFDGWVDADRTTSKIRGATRATSSPPECLNCNYESSCAWCVGGEYARTGELKRGISLCRIKKITAKYSDIYWKRYDESKQKEK